MPRRRATRSPLARAFDALAAASARSAPADLSLGTLSKADIADPARADAAFALPANEVSQPVKGAISGYVLLRVTKITPGVARTLDDVEGRRSGKQSGAADGGRQDHRYRQRLRGCPFSGGADIATAPKRPA